MLTRDDITALRRADNFHFHSHNGKNYIIAELHGVDYTKAEHRLFPAGSATGNICRRIDVADARCYDYEIGRALAKDEYDGFVNVYEHDILQTAFRALKVGDDLNFLWKIDGSDNTRSVGFHYYRFYLQRYNLQQNYGGFLDVWLLASYAGPDNSASMVRRTSKSSYTHPA